MREGDIARFKTQVNFSFRRSNACNTLGVYDNFEQEALKSND